MTASWGQQIDSSAAGSHHPCCTACCGCVHMLPADAAACVAASSLKHMLNSQDALLGPWLPGRDMLEDELRTFVGECMGFVVDFSNGK